MDIAVVSARGLGDGLISMVLSHNLQLQGHSVTTFNPFLPQLQKWFPKQKLLPYPQDIAELHAFDKILSQDHTPISASPYFSDKLVVLRESTLDKTRTLAENFALYCQKETSTYNGLIIPKKLTRGKKSKCVAIHPTSGDPKKNWSRQKFITLAKKLRQQGFLPTFVVSPQERAKWPQSPYFATIHNLASFLTTCSALIGNDSGVGHLASNLGIPTLTLFARKSTSHLWRPAWSEGRVVTPLPLLLGAPAKEKHWSHFLSVNRVLSAFEKLHIET